MEQFPKLNEVKSSEYCLYSVIEYKLSLLYKNQEVVYQLLKKIYDKVSKQTS